MFEPFCLSGSLATEHAIKTCDHLTGWVLHTWSDLAISSSIWERLHILPLKKMWSNHQKMGLATNFFFFVGSLIPPHTALCLHSSWVIHCFFYDHWTVKWMNNYDYGTLYATYADPWLSSAAPITMETMRTALDRWNSLQSSKSVNWTSHHSLQSPTTSPDHALPWWCMVEPVLFTRAHLRDLHRYTMAHLGRTPHVLSSLVWLPCCRGISLPSWPQSDITDVQLTWNHSNTYSLGLINVAVSLYKKYILFFVM